MKPEEKIAKLFLKTYFQKEPIYEPLGKSAPPDFCIEITAFEVRRLNQHYILDGGKAEGLEQVDYSLNKALRGEFSKIPISPGAGSFFWGLEFQRPLHASVGKIAKEIAKKALAHYVDGSKAKRTVTAHGVTVELIPASDSYERAFLPGFDVDGDSGGWVGEIYLQSIEIALKEKISKTRSIAGKFDRWVLILVDCIHLGAPWVKDMGPIDLNLQHFNCIAVINQDGSLAIEWPSSSLASAKS
jgi:hypothetical protein